MRPVPVGRRAVGRRAAGAQGRPGRWVSRLRHTLPAATLPGMNYVREIVDWIESNSAEYTGLSDELWAHPEVGWEELHAVAVQSDYLEQAGFTITRNVADIPTAFIAEWGTGSPVFGFVGEYDALPGLSQTRSPFPEAVRKGGPGHGCGHNLLGTGCLAAAMTVRGWMMNNGVDGTIRYYGCPAEERISGKTFMARAGVFDDLDAAFNFHPAAMNMPGKGTAVGVNDITFRFTGTAAHAGGAPEQGRSALDAVELMNVGVNYLREHVPEKVRIHYAITKGGDVPNIVPAEAEVWYFIRALERAVHDDVTDRVRKIAHGAAMMTETSVEEQYNGGCSSVRNNKRLADLHFEMMEMIGPIDFSSEELALAQSINDRYPAENRDRVFKEMRVPPELRDVVDSERKRPLVSRNFPSMDQDVVGTGSTDVGDVSRITPLTMLRTTCFPIGASGHSWGIVAASGSGIGHRGMLHAAKIMAAACASLFVDPEILKEVRSEFEAAAGRDPYVSPLPDDVTVPPAVAAHGKHTE